MAETMDVLYVEPGKEPRLVSIGHDLKSMQRAVGGYIQAVYPWEDPVALVCNEEGKLNDMVPNRMVKDFDLICGPFFICGLGREDFSSLPSDLAEKYAEMFRYPEAFYMADDHYYMLKVGSAKGPELIA